MQHGEVTRQPCRGARAQGGEGLGDGPAHERESGAVLGETDGIGPARYRAAAMQATNAAW